MLASRPIVPGPGQRRRRGFIGAVGVGRLGIALLLALGPAAAFAAEGLRVEAFRSGSAISVVARAALKAPLALIWETLTDYDHLSEFVPGMKKSRVIGRRGQAAIVEQDGEAGFLLLKYPVRVMVESAEYPPRVITVRVVRGNLRQLEGHYQIDEGKSAEEYVLRWTGVIEPDTVLPAFITVPLMRLIIEHQFVGIVREIERRHLARKRKETHVSTK